MKTIIYNDAEVMAIINSPKPTFGDFWTLNTKSEQERLRMVKQYAEKKMEKRIAAAERKQPSVKSIIKTVKKVKLW